ncbi:Clp protease N-terminal domain-containing protein [Spirillospora sp. NPDC050679]
MFERFTDRARRAVVLAQEESRLLGHDHIGTGHLLLGLVRDPDPVLAGALEVDLPAVRAKVGELVGEGAGPPGAQIPFTPRAKRVLELSLREAMLLGHDHIDAGHLLLGLLCEPDGRAVQALAALEVSPPRLREAVRTALNARPGRFVRQPRPDRLAVIEDRLTAIEAALAEVLKRLPDPGAPPSA